MKKLLAASTLAKHILATSVGQGRTLADSATFLVSKHAELQKYQGPAPYGLTCSA